jgi:hypothetical protein
MPSMTQTFTSTNDSVFVHFSTRCTYGNTSGVGVNFDEHRLNFRILLDGAVIKEFRTYGKLNYSSTEPVSINYYVPVSVGIHTIKIQWCAEYLSTPAVTFYNYASTQDYAYRSLIIYEIPHY